MRESIVRNLAFGVAASLTLLSSSPCSADFVTFTTPVGSTVSGSLVSSTATLTTLGNGQLQVVLTDGLATLSPAQVLSSILFNVSGANPTLTLVSGAPTAGSAGFTGPSTSDPSLDLTPGYAVINTTGSIDGFTYQHGLGSSGEGGIFPALGNEDYGIVGPGTDLSQSNFDNKFPLVMSLSTDPSSATFVLGGFGDLNASQITSLAFLYGSAPDGVITGSHSTVPEPAAAISTLTGLAIAGLAARRRLRPRA